MSPQHPVEMILLRQLASYLTIAIWMMDADGNLTEVAHWLQAKAQRSLCLVSDMVQPPKCVEDKKGD